MTQVLILSSHVAASRVGGMAQSLALALLGVDPIFAPTVLFGRHPGLGPPGGGRVDAGLLGGVVEGVQGHPTARPDAVITGYFVSVEQVRVAADAIDRLRDRAGPALVVVDPIMGDEGPGLYVPPEVAEAIETLLVPRADWLTPNLWELRRLTGRDCRSLDKVVAAARALSAPAVVTSVPAPGGRIGLLCAADGAAVLHAHARSASAPHGGGDLVAASFTAGLLRTGDPFQAAAGAAAAAAGTFALAAETGASELPIVAMGPGLSAAGSPVEAIRL